MLRQFSILMSIVFFHLLSFTANAHELRPAYLSVTEISDAEYSVLWKVPALDGQQLALKAQFPEDCYSENIKRQVEENQFVLETWTLICPKSLRGQSVEISGLINTLTDVLVKINWSNNEASTIRLTPETPSYNFTDANNIFGVMRTYFVLGAQHILGGVDHLLFVLTVMLLITHRKKILFYTITSFTIGHSVTLFMATMGFVFLEPKLVEALIAMSIVLMAYEVVRFYRGHTGLTVQYPWVVTFCFGLLHGFGFASALTLIGLPKVDLIAATLFFNAGVEAGQLLFISMILILWKMPYLTRLFKNEISIPIMGYAIGTVAVFWTLIGIVEL